MIAAFDSRKLDSLMESAGIDWVIATSNHNVSYLLGGYRYFFHRYSSAMGLSRYLPMVGYARGSPDHAFYVATHGEGSHLELQPVWTPNIYTTPVTAASAADAAATSIKGSGLRSGRIAIEPSFLPMEAAELMAHAMPEAQFVNGTSLLEDLRAVKSPQELDLLRTASEGIVDSILGVFESIRPGHSKDDIVAQFRREVVARGLDFDYALVTVGRSLNRAPFGGKCEMGDLISIDSGGRYNGYIGDLCRMAVLGTPTRAMLEALDEVASVQSAARSAVQPGALGRAVYDAALAQVAKCARHARMRFVAHGMGLIAHEAPRLTAESVVPYPATHAGEHLKPGMVISVETHISDPDIGFVKLEDMLIVTLNGSESAGDRGRGWNRAGEKVAL